MKKVLFAAIAVCMAILAVSCEKATTSDSESALYGIWVLDKHSFESEVSLFGSTSTYSDEFDFTKRNCVLILDGQVMYATAQFGGEMGGAQFTYDAEKKTITFLGDGISVWDDGKYLMLIGKYEVARLTEKELVLKQPDTNVTISSIFSGNHSGSYTFHKRAK